MCIQLIKTISVGELVAGSVTFLAILVAIFREWIWGLFFKPCLSMTFARSLPYVQEFEDRSSLELDGTVVWVAYRVGIKNSGNRAANGVRVYINNVQKSSTSGEWTELSPFVPVSLQWTHSESDIQDSIPSKYTSYVNLGNAHYKYLSMTGFPKSAGQIDKLSQTDIYFRLFTKIEPIDAYNYILPGKYRLHLVVTANNSGTFVKKVILEFDTVASRLERFEELRANPVSLSIE